MDCTLALVKMRRSMRLAALVAMLFVPAPAIGQQDKVLDIRGGVGTVTAKGYIGGEAHDRYAISVEAGHKLTVSISSPRNHAQLVLSESGDFSEAEPVTFGNWTKNRASWSGVVSQTDSFFIFVTARPTSTYKIR